MRNWTDVRKRRQQLEKYAIDHDFNPLVPENWINVTISDQKVFLFLPLASSPPPSLSSLTSPSLPSLTPFFPLLLLSMLISNRLQHYCSLIMVAFQIVCYICFLRLD
jgi:hypothetical protein